MNCFQLFWNSPCQTGMQNVCPSHRLLEQKTLKKFRHGWCYKSNQNIIPKGNCQYLLLQLQLQQIRGNEFIALSASKFILCMYTYGVKELCPCRLQCSVSSQDCRNNSKSIVAYFTTYWRILIPISPIIEFKFYDMRLTRTCLAGTTIQCHANSMFNMLSKCKISQAISRTTQPNIGMFVLILLHFSCRFQI